MKVASLLLTVLALVGLALALGGCPSGRMMRGDLSTPEGRAWCAGVSAKPSPKNPSIPGPSS